MEQFPTHLNAVKAASSAIILNRLLTIYLAAPNEKLTTAMSNPAVNPDNWDPTKTKKTEPQ
jgi:hypothetical protein